MNEKTGGNQAMSKIDQVRAEMMTAMKQKDKPRKDALSPVSYTHLDVYKRQALRLLRTPQGRLY